MKYAVGKIDFFNNDLEIKIVDVNEGWKDALETAFPGYGEHLDGDDVEAAKEAAWNQDWMFDVKEVE